MSTPPAKTASEAPAAEPEQQQAATDAPAAPSDSQQPAAPPPPPTDSNLISEEGELSDEFYAVLKQVFLKHSKQRKGLTAKEAEVLGYSDEAVMGRSELDAFAQATNGQDLSDDSYKEIVEYLDVTDKQELTFKGFTQLYTLQTQNDHAETVHDLEAWGYNAKTLKLASKEKKPLEEKKEEKKEKKEKK
ncbi:hypothetical protein JCM6882_005749 [Rhodosporidiobolus microsporus]